MKYAHILLAVASEPWAMDPVKILAMTEFLCLQAAGTKFTAEEVEARISQRQAHDVARREGAVAVLPLRGIIANRISMMGDISGGASAEAFGRAFRAAVDDTSIKAIVMDVDSPGGTAMGVDELSATIHAARGRKPIIAQVSATAASAAYWIASAADEVVVTPSGEVGSIGVFTVHEDVSAALEKLGVKRTLIASSDHKGEGLPFLPLSDEHRAHLKSRVDHYSDMFVSRVASNRGVGTGKVKAEFGNGRMVDARTAVGVGMADRLATMDETLARFGVGAAAPTRQRAFAAEREKRRLALG